tara:strand:+ start:22053 stop:23039 length:987 start_codon:yes stop_codon:yes gene_type:complete
MSDKAQYSGVGLFFIIGLVITYFVYTSLSQSGSARADGYPIRAPFNDILQLRVGDDVRMSGVKIGTVVGTSLHRGEAVAELSIRKQYEIPDDSVASISMAGLLGTNFVSIKMGRDYNNILTAGSDIRTKASVDINMIFEQVGDVAGRIDSALADVGGMFSGEGDGLFADISGLIKENRGRIGSSLENIEVITAQIREGKGTVGKLLIEDEGYNELLATVSEIKAAAGQADQMMAGVQGIVDHVKSGQGSLGELLYGDALATGLKSTITNVQEFSARLNDPDSTIGRLLSDDTIYFEVQSVVRKANRTLDSINDSGPISAVGVVTGALF